MRRFAVKYSEGGDSQVVRASRWATDCDADTGAMLLNFWDDECDEESSHCVAMFLLYKIASVRTLLD